MLRRSAVQLRKRPVNIRHNNDNYTHQFKRMLVRERVHKAEWDPRPLQIYPADRLAHANRRLDQHTGQEVPDVYRRASAYEVPDQQFAKFPVPDEYKDAYWIREREARRAQVPMEWIEHRKKEPWRYDTTDDSYAEKFTFSDEEVIAHARRERR